MHQRKTVDRYWQDLANIEVRHQTGKLAVAVRLNRVEDQVEFTLLDLAATSSSNDSATVAIPFGRWLRLARWSTSGIVSLREGRAEAPETEEKIAARQLERLRVAQTEVQQRLVDNPKDFGLLTAEQWILAYRDLVEKFERVRDALERRIPDKEGAAALEDG